MDGALSTDNSRERANHLLGASTLPVSVRWHQRVWFSLRRDKFALFGVGLLAFLSIIAMLSPLLTPHDPNQVVLADKLLPPVGMGGTWEYPLGTDSLGRDILSRLISGARISLLVAVAAVAISGVIGITLGVFAGYFGGLLDTVLMRIVDIQLAFPSILLYLAILAVLEPSLFNVILVLGISRWEVYARMVRGTTLSLREEDFVLASRTVGAGPWRIMWKHVLPNEIAPIIVIASFSVATVIIAEASLSFLGLGVPNDIATWGGMLSEGRDVMRRAWWPIWWPGIAIMVTVLGVNVVGDWVRDYLDPRMN